MRIRNKIDIKELFERVVTIETKLDLINEENKKTRNKFTGFVTVIIVLEVINLVVHIVDIFFL